MKELKLKLNTQESRNEITTKKITGILKYIIISNEKKIDIKIESELGYIIYKQLEHEGISNFPLKSEPRNSKGHQLNFIADDFHLNEKLLIEVTGPKNSDVLMILRYV